MKHFHEPGKPGAALGLRPVPECAHDPDLDELRTLLEQNKRSIETLRSMIENMESLFAALAHAKGQTGLNASSPELRKGCDS